MLSALSRALSLYRDRGIRETLETFRKKLVRRGFEAFQRTGVHVLPVHFYVPIPDTRTLDESVWERRSELPGVDLDLDRQLSTLSTLAGYREGYEALPRAADETSAAHEFYLDNGFYGAVDAEVLYAMIRHLEPDRVIEIGGGFSTRLAARAIRDGDVDCDLTTVEPYPDDALREIPELSELVERPVEDVPLERFESLGPDDVLFIDSSHVLHVDSDVKYEFLEVLPRLADGVVVHVHDVFLPGEYPREWVMDYHLFWNEQYLLQAFLAFNDAFQPLWSGSHLHDRHPEALAEAFSSYDREMVPPHSFWMRKVE